MSVKRRILVASVSVGAGHMRCADAVARAITRADASVTVDEVDVLDFAPAWARRFYRESFLRVAARSRSLAYRIYTGTDGERPDDPRWGHLAERLMFRRFRALLRAGAWNECICTHFLPCQLAPADERPRMRLVVTDFALHRFWVQPLVDDFFVATDELAATLRSRLPRARAHATGIPVGATFGRRFDRAALRSRLRLPQKAPVVLLVGGGWGLGLDETARAALAAGVPGLQLVAVCGANVDAYRRLAASGRVRALGFVDDLAPLIAAADLVVSKPGGVTTSETLALGRPLLLTPGLPGHEDRNAAALTRMGAARLAGLSSLASTIERFFHDDVLREGWACASRAAGRADAADRVAAIVLAPGAAATPAARRSAAG